MIPTRKRRLPPYGDIDEDGAPNWSDCDPYDPEEQGIFKRAAHIISRGKYGQSKEEYEQEKYEKALRKAQLAELEAQAQQSSQPLREVSPTKEWLARQGQRELSSTRLEEALKRIAKPTQRVGRTVSSYTTGEQWTEPPIMQRREPQYQEPIQPPIQPTRRGPRYRYQRGSAYSGRTGYCSVPPGREPVINIFRDAPKPPPQNTFKRRRRRY